MTAVGGSELELLARIARGDRGAFEQLFREHYAALVRFGEGLLRSRELAEDTVQELKQFLRVLGVRVSLSAQ